ELRDPGKKGGKDTHHRQPRAEASDHASDQRLHDTDSAERQTQFYVVGPQPVPFKPLTLPTVRSVLGPEGAGFFKKK
ncbi:hypothetical protein SE11_22675, partial [Salmonella enterica subsp. enterica serovar Braenderup]